MPGSPSEVIGASSRAATVHGPSASPPLLEVSQVSKTWPGAALLLAAVDLTVAPGELAVIVGVNGAGKTTLLRIVAGLISPDSGAVTLQGLSPDRDRTRFQQLIGYLGAGNSGLYGRLTAEHHLAFWARLALLPRADRSPAIAQAIETFALAPLLGRRVDRLSMGERQRLRLGLAFLHGPRLVLLDEPATSLDEDGIAMLAAALDAHRAGGGSGLICMPTGWERVLGGDRRLRLERGSLVPV